MKEEYYLHYYDCAGCRKRISELESFEFVEEKGKHYCWRDFQKIRKVKK